MLNNENAINENRRVNLYINYCTVTVSTHEFVPLKIDKIVDYQVVPKALFNLLQLSFGCNRIIRITVEIYR